MADDKIIPLGVTFKKPDDGEKMLSLVTYSPGECREHSYLIDPQADTVTCKNCPKVFNPMAVLVDLCRKESRWMNSYRQYHDEMKRLDQRQRTKCEHCDKMTRISRS
ncbi:MAG: hypothetical protein WC130_03660 [Kiritimatiellia bacterium]